MATKAHVDQIYESLQKQPRRLSPSERRRVLVYLSEIGELAQKSNYELARLFLVNESAIRDDKKRMLLSIGHELTPENAMALIAKHTSEVDALIRLAYRGLADTTPGGLAHRNYLETLSKLQQQKFSALQDIGVVRKELGHMNVTHEEWEAKISDDAVASVSPKLSPDDSSSVH